MAVEAGKTIFIPGGSGSFGQLAVPIAKSLGLTVIVSGNAEAREHILQIRCWSILTITGQPIISKY